MGVGLAAAGAGTAGASSGAFDNTDWGQLFDPGGLFTGDAPFQAGTEAMGKPTREERAESTQLIRDSMKPAQQLADLSMKQWREGKGLRGSAMDRSESALQGQFQDPFSGLGRNVDAFSGGFQPGQGFQSRSFDTEINPLIRQIQGSRFEPARQSAEDQFASQRANILASGASGGQLQELLANAGADRAQGISDTQRGIERDIAQNQLAERLGFGREERGREDAFNRELRAREAQFGQQERAAQMGDVSADRIARQSDLDRAYSQITGVPVGGLSGASSGMQGGASLLQKDIADRMNAASQNASGVGSLIGALLK